MDHHHQDTNNFEVNVQSDRVSNSETYSTHQIPINADQTFSWNINDCSSSFQSVSSCETLESYEGDISVPQSPKVIVVPFISDDDVIHNEEVITEDVSTNNKEYNCLDTLTHVYTSPGCPTIKECSIRIDQMEMTSFQSQRLSQIKPSKITAFVKDVNESSLNPVACTIIKEGNQQENQTMLTECSEKVPSYFLLEDDSVFEGFDEECSRVEEYETYKKAINLINNHNVDHNFKESIESLKNKNIESLKRPAAKREINRKNSRFDLSDQQPSEAIIIGRRLESPELVSHSKTSTIDSTEQTAKPKADSNISVNEINTSDDSDSSESENKVTSASVEGGGRTLNSKAKRKQQLEQREARKMEKMRRKKELKLIAERIRDQWRRMAEERRQRRARKMKVERNKYKTFYTKNDRSRYQYHGERKRKRVSHSESGSSDSSNTSKTSNTSNSSDSSTDSDTTHRSYTSDTDTTHRSYTSDTSCTDKQTDFTDSETSDSDSSDISTTTEERYHYKYRRASESVTSDTSSDTSDDTFARRRRLHFLKKALRRKQAKTKLKESSLRSKNKMPLKHRLDESNREKKLPCLFNRSHVDSYRKEKSRKRITNVRRSHSIKRFDCRSRPYFAKFKKAKSNIDKQLQIVRTTAGNFYVTIISSNDYNGTSRTFI